MKRVSAKAITVPAALLALVAAVLLLFVGHSRAIVAATHLVAAGRAVFVVTDHAIVVAAISDPRIPNSHPPAIVPIGGGSIGVMVGPIEWDQGTKRTRFDAELPTLASNTARHIDQAPDNEPSDVEKLGISTLEMLRPMVEEIHDKIELPKGQPYFELVVADYASDYGPEIWSIRYQVRQRLLQTDFWNSEIQRPGYFQLYPPPKGQPHSPVEIQYPAAGEPSLLDRLVRHDPAFDAIRGYSNDMAQAADAYARSSTAKLPPQPIASFLRSALPLMNTTNTTKTSGAPATNANAGSAVATKRPAASTLIREGVLEMALLEDRRGFQWLLPPAEGEPAPSNQEQQQDPGAPTLRKYTPPREQQ